MGSFKTLAYYSRPKYWKQKKTKILKQNVWQLAPVYPIRISRFKLQIGFYWNLIFLHVDIVSQ